MSTQAATAASVLGSLLSISIRSTSAVRDLGHVDNIIMGKAVLVVAVMLVVSG